MTHLQFINPYRDNVIKIIPSTHSTCFYSNLSDDSIRLLFSVINITKTFPITNNDTLKIKISYIGTRVNIYLLEQRKLSFH